MLAPEASIDELRLRVRSWVVLHREGIETIGALTAMTAGEVGRLRALGVMSVRDIQEALAEVGASLKPEDLRVRNRFARCTCPTCGRIHRKRDA